MLRRPPLPDSAPVTVRYACATPIHGVAVAAWRCLDALRTVGVGVVWQPLEDLPGGCTPAPSDAPLPADLARLTAGRQDGETLLLHADPQGWTRCRQQLRPARVIGHTVWETDRVPALWRAQMQAADELWVPTSWNRAAFEAAFDVPVHVVPHAASSAVPEAPPVELRDSTFVVATVGSWDWRKRPDLTIAAFLRAFGPEDDAALVLKTAQWPLAWPSRPDLPTVVHVGDLVPEERSAQVHVSTARWSEGQVLGLLDRADCFLSTTASEGWGLGAFDAACLGTPVVITGFGGQVEWLGTDHPGLLPYHMVPATHPYEHLFEPGMEWAEADLDVAVDQLRALAHGRNAPLEEATRALQAVLSDRYSPRRVGRIAADALGVAAPVPRRALAGSAPSHALDPVVARQGRRRVR